MTEAAATKLALRRRSSTASPDVKSAPIDAHETEDCPTQGTRYKYINSYADLTRVNYVAFIAVHLRRIGTLCRDIPKTGAMMYYTAQR